MHTNTNHSELSVTKYLLFKHFILFILYLGFSFSVHALSTLERAIQEHDHQTLKAQLLENPQAWKSDHEYLGESPIGLAIQEANLVALKLFVENGYHPNPDDWYQHPVRLITPFTSTDTPEHMQMLKWLLSQIDSHPDLDYHLLDFVQNNHYSGAEILLQYGVEPNIWVDDWNSPLDLTDDPKMQELLKQYGAVSNFNKVIFGAIALLIILFVLGSFILKPRQSKVVAGQAASPERNARKGNLFHIVGAMIFILGAAGILFPRFASVFGWMRPSEPLLIYAVAIVFAGFGLKLVLSGRKLKSKDAEDILKQASLHKGKRPIFVYLRSFRLDEQDANNQVTLAGGLSFPINPWESGIAAAFQKVGDLIAIGKPGEKLATLGASRLYVTDDQWQEKVIEMVAKSEMVIWTYGDTEGLRWEISRLVEIVPPEKLVIAMPFWDKKMSDKKVIWQHAKESLSSNFNTSLPETVGESLFLMFDKDWKSSWVETSPPALIKRIAFLGFWSRISKGVESLLNHRGYTYPKLSFIEKLFYGFFALLGWVVVSVLAIMIYGLIQSFL